MEIRKIYLEKYLHEAAVEQLADDYLKLGYKVYKNRKIQNFSVDLIARKKNETILLEIKSGIMNNDKRKSIEFLGNYVREHKNHKLYVVIATSIKDKKIEISDLDLLLVRHLIEEFPDNLDELATHTSVREVLDVEIDEIEIRDLSIFVTGNAIVVVNLQFGSDRDNSVGDGIRTGSSFPFDFSVTLQVNKKSELTIVQVDRLEIDTSSYYM